MSPAEEVRADYETAGLSPLAHPVSFIRPMLARRGALDIRSLERLGGVGEPTPRPGTGPDGAPRTRTGPADGRKVFVGGLIVGRQHPGTARGFVFLSLEDETGLLNVIISPDLFAAQRTEITQYPFVVVEGVLQCRDLTVSLKASRVHPLWVDGPEASGGSKIEHAAALLAAPPSRDFR
ncbi:MAG: hypothetical protein IV100_23415 [Myxococcales bacterium]|nr:hypothetical protein [Myxococcales bacterium]